MFKKLFVLLFLIISIPFSVQAHTTLLSSTPAEGENVAEALEEVQLVFGTKIEEGSTMTIEGESESFEFANIAIAEDTMVGDFKETLPNGSYRILWNIIGEDGHPIEGEVAFGVSIEAEEEVETSPVETEVAEELANPVVESAEGESGGNLMVTVLLILAAVLVIYGIYKLLLKKE
ncbi:copper resistance CopC family protein [Planococcus sp. SE5232]|uniref:copper resistance CopC family protein n=1 Tax=unclassified Planococcus (in: firmicutes) TaxID=2662419 RepID=UPI001CBBE389|nr:copper resistance CopC family protein [Planococcus sp. 4-30]